MKKAQLLRIGAMSRAELEREFKRLQARILQLESGLYPRENDTLNFLAEYKLKNGRMPSTREMASHLGVAQSTVAYNLVGLERKGRITRQAYEARAITICERP